MFQGTQLVKEEPGLTLGSGAESCVGRRGLQSSTGYGLSPGSSGPEAPGLGVGSGEAPAPPLASAFCPGFGQVSTGWVSPVPTLEGVPAGVPRKPGTALGRFGSERSSLLARVSPAHPKSDSGLGHFWMPSRLLWCHENLSLSFLI